MPQFYYFSSNHLKEHVPPKFSNLMTKLKNGEMGTFKGAMQSAVQHKCNLSGNVGGSQEVELCCVVAAALYRLQLPLLLHARLAKQSGEPWGVA